jgi:glycosyltransferase involved in cell wall biosynthesis
MARTVIAGRWPTHQSMISQFSRLIKRNDCKKILVHFLTDALRFKDVWLSTDKPVFVHCHGYDVTWDLRHIHAPGHFVHSPDYLDRALALPDNVRFIANSVATKKRLLDAGFHDERIDVKHLGTEIPDSPIVRDNNRDELTVLYLGRLIDFKGPDLTIRAFERASELGFRGRLVIAGDGPLRSMCELMRIRSTYSDRIELLGSVDKETGARLRRDADIFTAHNCKGPITGQEEAFGVSVVEAMADGLAVVSGANGSLPELIDDEVHGLLVDPGDVDAHARALLRLQENAALRLELGRRGRARAQERFSIERESSRLREILGIMPVTSNEPVIDVAGVPA